VTLTGKVEVDGSGPRDAFGTIRNATKAVIILNENDEATDVEITGSPVETRVPGRGGQ
jgi:hypothetical protein